MKEKLNRIEEFVNNSAARKLEVDLKAAFGDVEQYLKGGNYSGEVYITAEQYRNAGAVPGTNKYSVSITTRQALDMLYEALFELHISNRQNDAFLDFITQVERLEAIESDEPDNDEG